MHRTQAGKRARSLGRFARLVSVGAPIVIQNNQGWGLRMLTSAPCHKSIPAALEFAACLARLAWRAAAHCVHAQVDDIQPADDGDDLLEQRWQLNSSSVSRMMGASVISGDRATQACPKPAPASV